MTTLTDADRAALNKIAEERRRREAEAAESAPEQNGKDSTDGLNPLLQSFGFLDEEPAKPQAMLIEDILPLEGLPFIGGQSSAGKTFIAILMATCLATGKPFFGHEIRERIGCAIIAAEGRAMLPN